MKFNKTLLCSLAALALTGCATNSAKPTASAALEANNNDFYEVHTEEGRIYAFDDWDTYQSFLTVGETPYVLARIGEGPKGQTVKFGLTSADKKKREGIAVVDMYDGKLAAAEDFYGELRSEGRIYVFDRYEDIIAVRTTGEAPLRFTEIGTGPKGETVVYVLRGDNKKVKPVALMSKFNNMNAIN